MKKLVFVVNRRGCKHELDAKTALALEKMAEAAYAELSAKIAALPPTTSKLMTGRAPSHRRNVRRRKA